MSASATEVVRSYAGPETLAQPPPTKKIKTKPKPKPQNPLCLFPLLIRLHWLSLVNIELYLSIQAVFETRDFYLLLIMFAVIYQFLPTILQGT